jgi:hypothetical protein
MKSFKLLILLTVLYASPYAFAQIPSCPCDTEELPNGNSGDEIVEILCPGGNLAFGNTSAISDTQVLILRPGGEKLELGYEVNIEDVEGGDKFCRIFEETVADLGFKLSDEDYENCRQRLIQGCNLTAVTNIPTLGEWGMIAFAGVLGMIGLYAAARRRKAAA